MLLTWAQLYHCICNISVYIENVCFGTFMFILNNNNNNYGGRESSMPLQLQKTHANRKSTSKLRKQLHQFDSTCAANTLNTTKYITSCKNPTKQAHRNVQVAKKHNKIKMNYVVYGAVKRLIVINRIQNKKMFT